MNIKNKEKVLRKLKKPSKNKLNIYERLGLASGGALLIFAGIRKARDNGWALVLAGSALAISGIAGKNPLRPINKKSKKPLKVKSSVTIGKTPEEVYDFWRQLGNLPFFMEHIKDVKTISDIRSHWTANMHKVDMSWDAEITEDERGKVIAWRSLPDSEVKTEGRVLFKPASGHRGTELQVKLKYAEDTGRLAKGFASLYSPVFSQQVKLELRKCKKVIEAGEVPTSNPELHTSL